MSKKFSQSSYSNPRVLSTSLSRFFVLPVLLCCQPAWAYLNPGFHSLLPTLIATIGVWLVWIYRSYFNRFLNKQRTEISEDLTSVSRLIFLNNLREEFEDIIHFGDTRSENLQSELKLTTRAPMSPGHLLLQEHLVDQGKRTVAGMFLVERKKIDLVDEPLKKLLNFSLSLELELSRKSISIEVILPSFDTENRFCIYKIKEQKLEQLSEQDLQSVDGHLRERLKSIQQLNPTDFPLISINRFFEKPLNPPSSFFIWVLFDAFSKNNPVLHQRIDPFAGLSVGFHSSQIFLLSGRVFFKSLSDLQLKFVFDNAFQKERALFVRQIFELEDRLIQSLGNTSEDNAFSKLDIERRGAELCFLPTVIRTDKDFFYFQFNH